MAWVTSSGSEWLPRRAEISRSRVTGQRDQWFGRAAGSSRVVGMLVTASRLAGTTRPDGAYIVRLSRVTGMPRLSPVGALGWPGIVRTSPASWKMKPAPAAPAEQERGFVPLRPTVDAQLLHDGRRHAHRGMNGSARTVRQSCAVGERSGWDDCVRPMWDSCWICPDVLADSDPQCWVTSDVWFAPPSGRSDPPALELPRC